MIHLILTIIGAYFLGSVPFGLLIAKAHGKDLRAIGSGNIGATNVSRALGKKWGYFCFALDVLKGALPMIVAMRFLPDRPDAGAMFLWLLAGVAAIIGHIFPVYLRFKGGKGVATSFGVVLGLWPYYTLCGLAAFAIWAVVVLIWRYISLGSIVASLAFPVLLVFAIAIKPDWHFARLWPLLLMSCTVPILVILRHSDNISRLLAGTENKIGGKNKPRA
jgi:glycerol-3-phosphate acyltransferase PlsY